MKKEKTIRTYQRRTKTGKIVTVKQHTAKYDAAEALKEAAKKKGAGNELEALKKMKPIEKPVVKKPADEPDYGFSADEYKAWYHWDQDADPKNKAALKVEKALKKQMGTKAYNKYFDEMSDSYSARGHNKAFKGLGDTFGGKTTDKQVKSETTTKESKAGKGPVGRDYEGPATLHTYKGDLSKVSVRKMKGEKGYHLMTPEGYSLARFSTKSAADKALGDKLEVGKSSKSATSKETKTSKGQPILGEKLGIGVSFKNNKEGIAWAKKNGEHFKAYDKDYYKVGDDVYGNITVGHGGTIWGKLNSSWSKRVMKDSREEEQRDKWRKEPESPTTTAGKTRLYKMLTSDTKLWNVPEKYKAYYTIYGNLSPKGKAFVKEYEGSKSKEHTPISKKVPAKGNPAMWAAENRAYGESLQRKSKTPRRGSKAAYEAAQRAKASLTSYVDASPYKRVLKSMNTYGGQVNKNELIGKLVKKGLSHAEASKIAGQFATKVKTEFTKSRQYRPGAK